MKSFYDEMTPLQQAEHDLRFGKPGLSGTQAIGHTIRTIKRFWHQFGDTMKNYILQSYTVEEVDGELLVNIR